MAQSNSAAASRRGITVLTATSHSHASPNHSHENVSVPYQWHDKHELMLRELEEARARTTQMEKTMRWWSDCTANWREKWSKVRSERNKAREEVRLLRCRLEAMQRETGVLQREKTDLESQLSQYGISKSHHKAENGVLHNHVKESPPYHESDSPERDNNVTKKDPLMSPSQSHILNDVREANISLLEEMFGCQNIEEVAKGVENVSVYVHSSSETSKLNVKSRTSKEEKASLSEKYLNESAEKDTLQMTSHLEHLKTERIPLRENDIEEKLQNKPKFSEVSADHRHSSENALIGSGSGNSSSQPSPSHRVSAMSDPLPETCHVSPRISAISDPLSEVCGTSECSETGYAESIRSSEGMVGRRWRGGCGISAVSSSVLDDSGITPEQESLEQQVTMLKLRLEEATKTIQAERDEKNLLDRENSRWQGEVGELRARLEDVRASRQEAVKELVALRALHQKEVQTLQLEMLDEASTRECIDRRDWTLHASPSPLPNRADHLARSPATPVGFLQRSSRTRLADLRCELERLQEENAAEWGKRERLESEKLGLERENKKLRSQIGDLEERLDKRNKMAISASDADVGNLKDELGDRNKELSELKHAHSKLKKVLSDKSTELQHCNRRADQYEGEVKRLRSRVDELKKELAASEDEVDGASNNIRKLQRTNDELQENVENLQVQVEHLQSRLRNSTHSLPLRSGSLLRHESDDEPPEFLT